MKNAKLSGWIMQDGNIVVEAVRASVATNGKWHHVAAVVDRKVQTLSLHLNGKPDGTSVNIAGIGVTSSDSPLTIGAFGGAFPFDGSLDEVSIHRAALAPADFSFSADYATVLTAKLGARTGIYTTTPCDWGQPVQVTSLPTTAATNDGTITANVEASNDEFKTIVETRELQVKPGDQTAAVDGLQPTHYARVVITLTTPESAERSPVLSEITLTGKSIDP